MKKSPLNLVKDQFGDKTKLVEAIRKLGSEDIWLDKVNEDKGLERVSNRKLLRLHAVLTAVTAEFSSRGALLDALVKLEGRDKDAGFRSRLERHPLPRLWDALRAARARHKAAA